VSTNAGTRRPQAERRAEATTRLLEATIGCVVQLGYAATTIAAIQERAAMTRGRRIHYFRYKNDLILAAMDYLFDRRMAELTGQLELMPASPGDRIDSVIQLCWDLWRGDLSTVLIELRTAARTDTQLAAALQAHEVRMDALAMHTLAELFGPDLARHPDFPAVMRFFAQAMNGIAQIRPVAYEQVIPTLLSEWKHLVRRLLT
jgi:AcrR family transcriptional regulator